MNAIWIEVANAKAFVRTRDHPPPHVHVVNRADRWEARVGFSFLTSRLWLIDVTPVANSPTSTTLNAVVDTVAGKLEQFRKDWWMVYSDADLTNRWVRVGIDQPVVELRRRCRDAVQITSAVYDPVMRTLSLAIRDGQKFVLPAGSGSME